MKLFGVGDKMRQLPSMSAELLGQTIASIAWAVSVFFYGLNSTGDWLQLLAASSWFFANMASYMNQVPNASDTTISAKTPTV